MKKIGILGGGVWGSALAKLLSASQVNIFSRDEKIVNSINNNRFNPRLKYVVFNENVKSTLDINTLSNADYLFVCLPSQVVRKTITNYSIKNKQQRIIICSKGIEIDTQSFLKDVVKEVIGTDHISILSGPCFSHEVAQNLPTAVTLVSKKREEFDEINNLFLNNNFRLYFSDDFIGCQLGGAIKNIYAIAAGITNGLNLGENAKSALITRSFVEIIRLGKVLGAKTETFYGLSGIGDLILTSNSLKSRNTYFGHLISSQPKISIEDHLNSQNTTEGYFTVKAVKIIADNNKIDMPIMNSVYNILYNKASIADEVNSLLNRSSKSETY